MRIHKKDMRKAKRCPVCGAVMGGSPRSNKGFATACREKEGAEATSKIFGRRKEGPLATGRPTELH